MTDSNQNEIKTSPGYSAKALNSFCAQAVSDLLPCIFYPFALFLVIGAVGQIPFYLLGWNGDSAFITCGTSAFIASFATCISWKMLPFLPTKIRLVLCCGIGIMVTNWAAKLDFSLNGWHLAPLHFYFSLIHPAALGVKLPAFFSGIFSSSAMYFDEKFIWKKSPTIVPTILVENSIEP